MKNKLLLASIFTLSFFVISSCKKKAETCKLGKSYISDGNSTPQPNQFLYYSDNRLQKIIYSNRTTDTFAYIADTLIITSLSGDGIVTSVFKGTLNSFGYVTDGVKNYFDYSGNITSTESYSLQYNSQGKLLQKSVTNASGVTLLNLNYEGNNSATGTLFVAGALNRKFIFYHGNAENKTGVDDFNSVFTPYFGNGSANLLDSVHIIALPDTIRIQYASTLDANEYVNKTVQTYLNRDSDTKYFTYEYFDCGK